MRVFRWIGACVALAFAAAAFTPLPNVLHARHRTTDTPRPADAIVVLGASVGEDGVLGTQSLRRLLHGLVLFRRGLAPRLLLLGPRNRSGVVEADVRARLAADLGVAGSAVLTEAGANTTAEEAALSARRLEPLGVRSVILVTGHYHMPRARHLFERAGFTVIPGAADEGPGADRRPEVRLAILRGLATEAVARLYNRMRGRI
jgi:uncharacterized SAM-binding protein YcdF (DUF218 family)